MLSKAEQTQIEIGMTLPASVLVEIVTRQANQSVFSEAECLRLASAYEHAASIAKQRRLYPRSNDSRNLPISGNEANG